MKLWQNQQNLDQLIEQFTIGQDNVLDLELVEYDIIGSKAHTKMLHSIGLLTRDELIAIHHEFDKMLVEARNGSFVIEPGVEDVHSQVELNLVRSIGEVGKKIHSGRSRNDQVLVDLKLYYKKRIQDFLDLIENIASLFVHTSENYKNALMPGYTHTQVGMVSSFGLWFASFGEALIDDYTNMKTVLKIINQNPLGSAAGYGNSFPLDREETTAILDFGDLSVNSMYAQFTRGKSELVLAQAIASTAYTLGKFANDVCLYANQDFGLITLPDELTTGSSIMPHKKNPDVFELLRAKSNQLMGLPNQIMLITNNLISGYHRDVQQLKELVFPAMHLFESVLQITQYVIPKISPVENLLEAEKYNTLFSVEEVNALVVSGLPFRDAYMQVKAQIADGSFQPNKDIRHTHIGSVGNLGNDRILKKLRKAVALEFDTCW